MSDLTKKAITNAFVQLISEKPLNKITVKELSELCGITRRTFYYHYQDIYDLVEKLFAQEAEKVVGEVRQQGELTSENWEDAMVIAAHFVIKNKQAVYHLYNSIRREDLERFLKQVTAEVLQRLMETLGRGIPAREEDRRLLVALYGNAFTGMIQDWIESGMKTSPEVLIRRAAFLLKGHLELSLRRSAEAGAPEIK